MTVLHASAVLAWLQREPGTNLIDFTDSHMTVLDFAEVLDAARQTGIDPRAVADALLPLIKVVPVYPLDVIQAASLAEQACMADRLALALADRLGTTLLTADALW